MAEGIHLLVRIRPNARQDRIVGCREGVFQIQIHAPAREGEANAALIRYLADVTEVPSSRIRILHGKRSREKRIWIETKHADDVRRRLTVLLPDAGSR